MKTVRELVNDLLELNQDAVIYIYCDKSGIVVPPNKIRVEDNDDEIPTEYHLSSTFVGDE